MGLKLLTLNLHCFQEKEYQKNFDRIVEFIKEQEIDIIAFQESAQFRAAPIVCGDLKEGNATSYIANALGKEYEFYWRLSHESFETVEEGLSVISKYPILNKSSEYITKQATPYYWNSRIIVHVEVEYGGEKLNIISCHMGLESETIEPYEEQLDRLDRFVKKLSGKTILLGDFNCSDDSMLYEKILALGYQDLYRHYRINQELPLEPTIEEGGVFRRIDYIFSNTLWDVKEAKVFFDQNKVSDHFAVLVELK